MKKHAKQSDLAIITKGLANIREGILNANWDNVCDGYNLIAGEKLNVPDTPPIHLLDSIRQIVNSPQDEETDEGNTKEDYEEQEEDNNNLIENMQIMSVAAIKTELKNLGIKPKSFKNIKTKKKLIEFVNSFMDSDRQRFKTTIVKHNKNAKFARGKLKIISAASNEFEQKQNRQMTHGNITLRATSRRITKPKDTSDDTSKSVRYYDNPQSKPKRVGS